MSWAGERRAIIIIIAGAILLGALVTLGFSIFYKTPTCTDKRQNQDEQGVDCGGSCTTLCAFQVDDAPVVGFVRALTPQPGRTDVVASVQNRNSDAESADTPFLLEVYGTERQLIASKTILVDLPPLSSVPVYVPDVAPRGSVAAQAFLAPVSDSIVWRRVSGEKPALPTVDRVSIVGGEAPRITATLVNAFARPVYDTTLVAIVRDASGNVIAASQTLVATLPSQGTAPLVFTWNVPFSDPSPRVEILPVPELSRAP
ncbi:MAG: hypothetical protein QOE22_523 [Candidatus Parcubacteria bacterium]|jgi:hypothetical protein|nr:hypothetical protein [Candidatus Parcubacteria bacterium]